MNYQVGDRVKSVGNSVFAFVEKFETLFVDFKSGRLAGSEGVISKLSKQHGKVRLLLFDEL